MKLILSLFTLFFVTVSAGAQTSLVNLKAGTWKSPATWLYERVPSDTDDVVLLQDIVVDTNAFCRSLTTNGYNVTVAPGLHLTITGHDSTAAIDDDTLISKLSVVYYGDTSTGNVTDQDYKLYEYDSLKRVSRTVVSSGFANETTTYFYLENSPYPYKTIYTNPCDEKVNNQCVVHNDTSYYKYNTDGIVIQDSSRSLNTQYALNYKHIHNYVITGDSVIRYALFNSFSISYMNGSMVVNESFRKDTTYYMRLLKNGNIIYQVGHNKDWHTEYIFSQDQKKNPLYPGSIHLPVLPLEMLLLEDPEQFNNNLSHEENYTFGSSVQRIKYKSGYRYKRNGFPLELIMLDEIENTVLILKYEYTK